MLIIKIIKDGFKFVRCFKIIAIPWLPPVTKFRGFKIMLKFNAAINKDINNIVYFFISHLY